ncbi:Mitochondrial phosphate carrier protein 1 mitochondrial [Euphorbia peplus]|nr:Mitochondrial phosphate carrier protein 1 mitochondrial [Euphorbia peplus]
MRDGFRRRMVEDLSPSTYYGICVFGGTFSAGTTHLFITPLDVLKVNMQVNPAKYNGISSGFSTLWKEQGPSSLWRGWSGKLFGYGVQGGCKFGLYEYFKRLYSDVLVDQNRTFVYFLSSASAQVFADVALCPFEAVKVRVQTQPQYAKGLTDGFPKLYKAEGLKGFYRGILPLWGRNLPFSMIMFSTFEHSSDTIYRNVLRRNKHDCSSVQQLGVTCLAGYMAGAIGTVISNPADNIMTSLCNNRAETVLQAIKRIGLVNLFTRSLPVRLAIVGPVVTLQWFFYDTIKLLCGLPTSGGGLVHHKNALQI